MKVKIEFECKGAAFEDNFIKELRNVLQRAVHKIAKQKARPDSLCTHPEAEDILRDTNGNVLGSVTLEKP